MTITQNGSLKRDDNDQPVMGGTSSVDNATIINAAFDPVTRRLLTDQAGGGSGTVQTVSVATANGFAGTSDADPADPILTLTTTVTGILKGNGTAISAVTVGTGLSFDGTTLEATAGGGNVSNTGTPLNNQIAVWTNATTIEGDADLTFDTATNTLATGILQSSTLTASEIVITDASKNLVSAAVATYPSLTELTYLKGVTSAIQTQLNAKGAGTVTSVGFTGGLISVANATTTPAFTVAGTSGGIPYFSAASTWASSAALAANAIVIGGGAGAAPSTTTTGTGVLTALGINVGSAGAFVTFNGALGTPSSGTVTNLTGTASININGTVGGTTPTTATFTTATINTSLLPDANDGAVLGAAGTAFSDLFLAEGAVINWDSSDVTLTQSGNSLTLAGGDLILAENVSVQLDPALSADGTYTGITITGTAGATLAFGDLIYLAVADSRWELTDADSATTAGAVLTGMCVLAAAGDGSATTILLQGNIRADAAFPALTVGANVYAGLTPGDIVTTAPSATDDVVHVVGKALTADSIYFNPSMDYITIV